MRTILLKTWRRTGASVIGDRSWAFKEKREMLKRWGKWKHLSIQNTCPQMFTAGQFIRAKIWNNLNFQKMMNGKTKCGKPFNRVLFNHKKKWSADMYYNMYKPWKHAKWKKSQIKSPYIGWFHLYEISRMGKSIEAESRLVGTKGWEEGRTGWGVTANGYRFSFGVDGNVLVLEWWLCNLMKILKNHWNKHFKKVGMWLWFCIIK